MSTSCGSAQHLHRTIAAASHRLRAAQRIQSYRGIVTAGAQRGTAGGGGHACKRGIEVDRVEMITPRQFIVSQLESAPRQPQRAFRVFVNPQTFVEQFAGVLQERCIERNVAGMKKPVSTRSP